MKNNALPISRQKVLTWLVVISLIGAFFFLRSYFMLIVISIILAFIFNPIYQWSLRKFKNKTGYALMTTYLALFFAFIIPLGAVLYITVNQAVQVLDIIKTATANSGSVQEAINQIIDALNRQLTNIPGVDAPPLNTEQVFGWLKSGAEKILSYSVGFARGLVSDVAGFFTKLIIFMYVFASLLKNQKSILKALEDINPLGKNITDAYLNKMGAMTNAMVKGQLIIALAQALSGVASLAIAGIDYLAFWFVILTFLSIIPLGGGVLLIPFGIVLILTGNIWQGIFIIVWHIVVSTNIDNVMRPKFVPKSARLDSALTILSVFSGISIFGFLGIIIGPVIMVLVTTTIESYLEYRRTGTISISNVSDDDDKPKKHLFKRLLAKTSAHK